MVLTRRDLLTKGLTGLGVLLTNCSGLQVREERPLQPKIERLSTNVLDIETYGYDVALEPYLKPNKISVVEVGAYWCSPCRVIQWSIKQEGAKFTDLDFILMDVSYPVQEAGQRECIYSPAYERYVIHNLPKNIEPSFPIFLVYQNKTLRGMFDYSKWTTHEKNMEYVVRSAREMAMPPLEQKKRLRFRRMN